MLKALLHALGQRGDGLRLVARGLIIGMYLKFGHDLALPSTSVPSHYTTNQKGGSAHALPPRKLN